MTEFSDASDFTDSPTTISWSSFLIRGYREGNAGNWRGEIVHLQTQDKQWVNSLDQISQFLLKHAFGLNPSPEIPGPAHSEKE